MKEAAEVGKGYPVTPLSTSLFWPGRGRAGHVNVGTNTDRKVSPGLTNYKGREGAPLGGRRLEEATTTCPTCHGKSHAVRGLNSYSNNTDQNQRRPTPSLSQPDPHIWITKRELRHPMSYQPSPPPETCPLSRIRPYTKPRRPPRRISADPLAKRHHRPPRTRGCAPI